MADDRVQLVAPDGSIGTVPKQQAERAIAMGYKPLSAGDEQELSKRQQYGQGLGTEIRAGTEGAARALSFGTSDLALQALGADKEGLAERKARNPYAEAVGEGIGLVGGTLATGGLGTLGAGVRGVEALGAGASRLTAGALTGLAEREGASVLSKALLSGASKAVGGAVEGGAYGLGQGISEASLGDPEDAANTLLAHATMGALFGGGVGAGVGIIGGIGRNLLEKSAAARQAARIADAVDNTAESATAAAETGGAQASLSQQLATRLQDLQGEQSLDAAGLMTPAYKKLGRQVKSLAESGDAEQVAAASEATHDTSLLEEAKRVMREKGIVKAGDTVADVGRKITATLDEAKRGASAAIASIDKAADAPLFDLREYGNKLEDYASKFADSPERTGEYKQLLERANAYRELAERKGNIPLAEAEKLKREFDSAFSGTSAAKQIARESRGMFNAQIEATVKGATGAEQFAQWKADKRTMEALIPVQEANIKKQAHMQSNRKVSLTDYLTGLGSAGAAAMGHPISAAVGLGGALVHKFIRERGNAFVADYAGRAAAAFAESEGVRATQLQSLMQAKGGVVNNVSKSVKAFVSKLQDVPKATSAAATLAGHAVNFGPVEREKQDVQRTAMKRQLDQLAQLTADPETFRLRLAESMGDMPSVAPRIAQEMHGQAWNAINFLYGKAPKNPYYAATEDLRDKWEPDPADTRAFQRYARAVNDPIGTLKDMENGHITAEAVESLQAVYPAIHRQLVTEMVPLMARAKGVPLQRRLEVAEILGTPLDTLTAPQLSATMQAAYAQQSKQPAAPARPAVSKNYRAQQSTTPLQRALENV